MIVRSGETVTPTGSGRKKTMHTALIAPCGMNCRLCRAYIRDRKACPGCRGDDRLKSRSCSLCRIKNCEKLKDGTSPYCFSCERFPCAPLKSLDKRYGTRYGMSMIDNLRSIKKSGIRHFIRSEQEKWTCPKCATILCVHKPYCLSCGHAWR
jgi:hypothetical protein